MEKRLKIQKPVYCENCDTLAVATMNGTALCTGCLICAAGNGRDRRSIRQIKPLKSLHSSQVSFDKALN